MAQENNIEQNLEELQKKCDEYLNNWKRERADFINYKKDELERTLMMMSHSKEKFILKLLQILDNIYLAQKHINNDGLSQVIKQFEDFLAKEGVEQVEVLDKLFDPNFMEIVEQADAESGGERVSAESGTVIEELQKGYTMHNKVLRPAKVKVLK